MTADDLLTARDRVLAQDFDEPWTAHVWNGLYPVGTPVTYHPVLPKRPDIEPVQTRTRSEAWDLGHGTPVVLVEGKTGGVALTHLEVRSTNNEVKRTHEAPVHVVLSFLTGRTIPSPEGEHPVPGMVELCSFLAGSPVPDSTVLRSPELFRPSLRSLLPEDLATLDADDVPTPQRAVELRDEVAARHGAAVTFVLEADYELLPQA